MILIAPLPVLIIAGVVGIAVIVSNKNNSTTSSSVLSDTTTAGGSTALDTSKQPVMLPLGGADQSSKPDPNALHVNNQPSSGRSLQQNQLGSGQGQQQQSNTGSTSGSGTQVPGPDTFEQYLQYKSQAHSLMGDIQVGTGAELKTGMKAAVLYKGWLTSGELFDESKADSSGKLQPFMVTLGAHQVIAGWEEGLVGMKVGGTRRIIVPPAVGYGSTGQGPIPGDAVLVFDVQLLEAQ